MQAKAPVNADPNKVVVVNTNDMPWSSTGQPGVSQKVMERVIDPRKGRETSLIKLDPGARLPEEVLDERIDIFVLEGSFKDEQGTYGTHTFVRNQPGYRFAASSADGCVMYMKRRVPIQDKDRERMVIDGKTAQWTPFPHRGADVLHLYRDMHGIETSRFGNVHPQKKIPSHDHAMGEETFIVKGVLKDEYTAYTPGVWFRMPIGIPHAPYTEDQNCLMLIREGDLVW
jgi:anti-sigma factor ChrR (cupin superfamily)